MAAHENSPNEVIETVSNKKKAGILHNQDLDLPEISDSDVNFSLKWYEPENKIFEGNLDNSDDEEIEDWSTLEQQLQNLYNNAEKYTTTSQPEPQFTLSSYHMSNHISTDEKEEDGRDGSDSNNATMTERKPYTAEFYQQPEHVQLGIYSRDIVALQDQNFHLQRQVTKEKEGHRKYKKECDMKTFEIERLSKERDQAWEEKFILKKKLHHMEKVAENLKEDLESERTTRETVPTTPKEVLEDRVCKVKYELAKYKEQCDDLNFRMQQLLLENTNLKELQKIQQKQIHDFGSLLSRSGVQFSTLRMSAGSQI